MTGRGRPHQAETPETKGAKSKTTHEEIKQEPLPTFPRKKKHNGTIKKQKPEEREQKKTNNTDEMPSVQTVRKEKTTKHQTTDDTKAPVRGTKANACTGRSKSAEETTETQPETPNDTTQVPMKITKVKACTGKAKSPEKSTEETMKIQLETTLKRLTIKRIDKTNASEIVNSIRREITEHVKQNIQWCKEVELLPTGSYYENLKISNPDEFDVMLAIPVDRVDITPFGDDGAFYSVGLKRGNNPLKTFQDTDTLSASKMLQEFREEVKKCVKKFPEWEVTKKKKGCPAVTLTGPEIQAVPISLDVVLCLKVKSSWPPFTKDGFKIEGWLGTKVKQEHKRKPYYFVPKYEGNGNVEYDGVQAKDVWRISFSHVEKDIMRNHGSEKTCCEKEGERCCRKDCLKLLKHLLSQLKEKNPSFDKFYSYQAKTTLLHACCSRTKDIDWRTTDLSQCFQQLLCDFIGHLEKGVLPNFFIPSQNLLSGVDQRKCNSLVCCIKEELESGFPIFK